MVWSPSRWKHLPLIWATEASKKPLISDFCKEYLPSILYSCLVPVEGIAYFRFLVSATIPASTSGGRGETDKDPRTGYWATICSQKEWSTCMLLTNGCYSLLQMHRPESKLGCLSRCSQSAAIQFQSKAMWSGVHRQELLYSTDLLALSHCFEFLWE